MRRICVYCGSSTGRQVDDGGAARQLADVLVRHELELVYGGAAEQAIHDNFIITISKTQFRSCGQILAQQA